MTTERGVVFMCGSGELLITGDAVLGFTRWVQERREALRRGGRIDPDVETWTDTALAAAERILRARTSAIGTSEVPIEEKSAVVRMLDPVTTAEAAVLIDRTPREVIRLIKRKPSPFPSAQIVAGRYLLERSEALARAERTS